MEEKFYLTRDKDGELHLSYCEKNELTKNLQGEFWDSCRWSYMLIFSKISSKELYPEVKWEDEEPTEVEIIIKRK